MEIIIVKDKDEARKKIRYVLSLLMGMGSVSQKIGTQKGRDHCRSVSDGLGDDIREFRAKNKFYEVV